MISKKLFRVVMIVMLLLLGLANCGPTPEPTFETAKTVPPVEVETVVTAEVEISPTANEEPDQDFVAILVIDDFLPPWEIIPSEELSLQGTDCVVSPSGQIEYAAEGAGDALLDVPHGDLVCDRLRGRIMGMEGYFEIPRPGDSPQRGGTVSGRDVFGEDRYPWLLDIELWETEAGYIMLVQIDTDGYETSLIGGRIEDAVSLLTDETQVSDLEAALELGAEIDLSTAAGFVLNMSFAIVPCDDSFGEGVPPEDLAAYYLQEIANLSEEERNYLVGAGLKLDDLEKTLDKLATPQPETMTATPSPIEMARDLTFAQARIALAYAGGPTFFDRDPLLKLLNNYLDEGAEGNPVSNIAAAGNFGFNFPFAPGIWESVVSVSAEESLSNAGEVLMKGAFECEINTTCYGTSFSAPLLSYLTAMHFLKGGSNDCQGLKGKSTPPLGYASLEGSSWLNLSFEDAVEDYCAQFR